MKDLLEEFVGKEVSLIKTDSGDYWQEVLVYEVKDGYVHLKGDGFFGFIKTNSIESLTIEEKEEELNWWKN